MNDPKECAEQRRQLTDLVRAIQTEANARGTDQLTDDDIEAEIDAVKRERRAKPAQPPSDPRQPIR